VDGAVHDAYEVRDGAADVDGETRLHTVGTRPGPSK
jgi:hypothetical protein